MSKLTLNESVVHHVTCERCREQYDYDQTATAEVQDLTLTGRDVTAAEQRGRAEAKLDRLFDRGLIVPCPRCKALTAPMRRLLWMAVLQDLVIVGIALVVVYGIAMAALASGGFAWGMMVLALLVALGYSLKALSAPFGGYTGAKGRPAGTPGPAPAQPAGDLFDSLKLGD